MIAINFTFEYKGIVSAKDFREIRTEAWKLTGEMYHKRITPEHFTQQGARRYNYKTRTFKHQRRKRKRFGHNNPLVFTGRMRRKVKQVRKVRARRGGRGGVVVGLNVPQYAIALSARSNAPNMAKELSAISPKDERRVTKFLDRMIQRKINAHTKRETRKVS